VGYNLGVITGCTNVGAVNSEYQESALDMEGLPATLLELVKKDMGDDLSTMSSAAPLTMVCSVSSSVRRRLMVLWSRSSST